MNWLPRIQLRTVFLLFVCAAVGLTTYPDLLGAISPMIATAMVIGMLQQTRCLLSWQPAEIQVRHQLAFARHFALVWRIVLAITIATCLLFQILVATGYLQVPEPDGILLIDPLTQGVLSLCLIIVLCNSLIRWRSTSRIPSQHPGQIAILCGMTLTVGLIALVGYITFEFLVHRAVAGIESAQPTQLQRAGVYPNLANEGYRSLWLAFGSILCLLAAGAITARLRRRPKSDRTSTWLILPTVLPFLIAPSIFCYWYYTNEFHRLSPEMAGAGLALTWLDKLAGAWLAIILLTAGAYRIGKANTPRAMITDDLSQDPDREAFHESFACLLLLEFSAIYSLVMSGISLISGPAFPRISISMYISILCEPTVLLMIGTAVASLQLCWIRWKRRNQEIAWEVARLSPVAFFQGWIALALILIVAIPTLRAFGFLLWLGPVDLLPFVGL